MITPITSEAARLDDEKMDRILANDFVLAERWRPNDSCAAAFDPPPSRYNDWKHLINGIVILSGAKNPSSNPRANAWKVLRCAQDDTLLYL